jgi:hypothetical protein
VPLALVIAFTDLARDPRVHRQIRALKSRFEVMAAGTGDPRVEGVQFVRCARSQRGLFAKAAEAACLLLGQYAAHYWGMAHVRELRERLQGAKADVVVANDIEALPLALDFCHTRIAKRSERRLVHRLLSERCAEFGTEVRDEGDRLVVRTR